VLRDSRLSYRARGVLAAILSRPDNWATTADKLAAEGSEGRDAVRSAMDELAVYGYLERRNVQVDAGRWVKQVIVYDQPFEGRSEAPAPTPDSQASVTGNPPPTTDFQASVNQASVFQASKEPNRELQPTTPTGSAAETSQTLVAEWIDHCNGSRPPSRVIGHIAKEIGIMLSEGIPYNDVRNGLGRWHSQGLHPSALASVVHELRLADAGQLKTRRQVQRESNIVSVLERAKERDRQLGTTQPKEIP
jgi:hypothetical protein